jgi:hypothetical protein
MNETIIEFNKLPIRPSPESVAKEVYYVVENRRSEVMDAFKKLNESEKTLIKSLINKMATVENFKSPKIINHLQGYSYGEIRPMPHRFFFFHKYDNNIIFFAYKLKKKDSLTDSIYNQINEAKERYEREFEKFIRRNK